MKEERKPPGFRSRKKKRKTKTVEEETDQIVKPLK